MVVIEQEPDAQETQEVPANASPGQDPAQGENGSDEESFEDALTDEQLREVRHFNLLF